MADLLKNGEGEQASFVELFHRKLNAFNILVGFVKKTLVTAEETEPIWEKLSAQFPPETISNLKKYFMHQVGAEVIADEQEIHDLVSAINTDPLTDTVNRVISVEIGTFLTAKSTL